MGYGPLVASLLSLVFMFLKYRWKEHYGVLFFGQIVFLVLSVVLLIKGWTGISS